jgi:Xaa-Pro aminopeptidase
MNSRIRSLIQKLAKTRVDAFLIVSPANISYLLGLQSRDSWLLVSKKICIYFTDSRYIEEVRPRLAKEGVMAVTSAGPVFDSIALACAGFGLKRLGFEGHHISFAACRKLEQPLKEKGVRLCSLEGLVEEARQVKDKEELVKIKRSLRVTAEALKFAKKVIRPGIKEIEVAGEMERFIRYRGAADSAFGIIVASGPNSAFPHHAPTNRKIRNNELVLIDIGVERQGYKSDLTWVYFLGKINFLARKVKKVVLEAQALAIKKIRPGVKLSEIDRVSRDHIAKAGYGECFSHSLGHGIGLETHEAPRISAKAKGVIRQGMVFTVEPGIYLKGKFGIRIEDMVLVTKKGCVVLSGTINK